MSISTISNHSGGDEPNNEINQPWIFTVDNIFIDTSRYFPDNQFLIDNDIKPGSQNTATTDEMKKTALTVLNMSDGEYGSNLISATVGGCAMNTTRAANIYLQSQHQNRRVVTLGSIGKDQPSEIVLEQLQTEKVIYDIHQDEEAITGQCAVTVVEADRTCIAVLDACEKYPTEHMVEALKREENKNCMFFYSTGFFIESNYNALKMMSEFVADSSDKIFAFNFAAEYVYHTQKEKTLNILTMSDFIFCNKDEAIACAKYLHEEIGLDQSDLTNLNEIAKSVAFYSKKNCEKPRVVVITNSDHPVTVAVQHFSSTISQGPDVEDNIAYNFTVKVGHVDKDLVVDSNGAGDSFVGGFIGKLCLIQESRKSSLQKQGIQQFGVYSQEELTLAIQTGNVIAGQVIQRYGCTFPDKESMARLISLDK